MSMPITQPKNEAVYIDQAAAAYRSRQIGSFVPILPALTLKGEPYSLADHAPFEPLYKLSLPHRMVWKCGRQVAKTTNMASQAVLHTATQSHLATLFVAPRYEQIRRISANYVKPFIDNSLFKNHIIAKKVENSVLQKSFLNEARMYFSFAFLSVDRIRGLSVDAINYDEIQDIDVDFVPIIHEAMSHSHLGMERFFGTPKTLDNTLQVLWEQTSQAEWVTKCEGCGLDNIPSQEYHLQKMIGPAGPICADCGHPLNPRLGRWIHAEPSRASTDAGYHIPQIVLPIHYEDPEYPGVPPDKPSEKWLELLGKRDGKGGYSNSKFLNEVLGESCDLGAKLITLTDIRKASVLNKNERRAALDRIREFRYRVLGVDWGGGGEDVISTTTYCITGLNVRTGKTECIYTARLHAGMTHDEEADILLKEFSAFQCHMMAHDYGGAGSVRETLMVQAGLPLTKIAPFLYVRASSKRMVEVKKPGDGNPRTYYTLDKSRSLVLQATGVKAGQILLPEYESAKNLTSDLLALIETRHDVPGRSDVYLITRNPKMTDDFAHALNFSTVGIWHVFKCYPDFSKTLAFKRQTHELGLLDPPNVSYEEPD